MNKKLLLLLVLFYITSNARQINNPQKVLSNTNKNFFIQNKGQWDPAVKYLARIGGMNAWITNSGVVYDYYKVKKNYDETKTNRNSLYKKMMNLKEMLNLENNNTAIQGHVIRMQLVNSKREVNSVGNNQREGYYNYFIGNDQSKWASYVPLYDNVELQGVYKDIDIKYYYDKGMLRYDYKAKPGADISQLKFKFEGQEETSINAKGELVLKTSIGEVTNGKIYAYQIEGEAQKAIGCKFEQKEDGTIGLKTESYDAQKELIIDPLVYSTFIGGNSDDQGNSIAIDANGDAYITGYTYSSNFPTTSGAYQSNLKTTFGNAFVTKLNSTGSGLIYSTFIGGNDSVKYVLGNSLAIDKNGNAYITGETNSSNFPTTSGAYQTNLGGWNATNVFITKLNSTGSALVYSTYIGGSAYDYGLAIALDANSNAYVTGYTYSSDYPATSRKYQAFLIPNNGNIFVTKLNSTGTTLVYSALIGGTGDYGNGDRATSIALDADGNSYITGWTFSSDYPTTTGVYQTKYSGESDAFVTKLNPTGTTLVYSTFIGGNNMDIGNSIAVDRYGNAYITGQTSSSNYPTTIGAFQDALRGTQNVFVTKLNPTGSGLVYSTFIGGNDNDGGTSIAVDSSDNAFITGWAQSSNFPTTNSAYQTTSGGDLDAFITKLNPTGDGLIYSTYFGGFGTDYGNSIAIDTNGNAYITGNTASLNYPTTSGAYQTVYGGTGFEEKGDAFVIKFAVNVESGIIQQISPLNGSSGLSQPVQLRWSSVSGAFSYGLQLSADSDFIATIMDTTGLKDTSFTISRLSRRIIYFWRVNETNAEGTGPWSRVWSFKPLITGINENKNNIPVAYELYQNYPNPFNPSTLIKFDLPFSSNVKIEVYNILGEKVRELLNEQKNAGYYEVNFKTNGLASGVYFYVFHAKSTDGKGEFRETKKMLLIK